MYSLVDGNNFYVTRERVPAQLAGPARHRAEQQRWLRHRALQRSQGAGHRDGRALVPDPADAARCGHRGAECQLHALWRHEQPDVSVAAGLGPEQEIYSIDESLIDLTTMRGDLVARSHRVRERIPQWIGIPCGIGIGSTKTLAKLANHIAKTADRKPGSYPVELHPLRTCLRLSLRQGRQCDVTPRTERQLYGTATVKVFLPPGS